MQSSVKRNDPAHSQVVPNGSARGRADQDRRAGAQNGAVAGRIRASVEDEEGEGQDRRSRIRTVREESRA